MAKQFLFHGSHGFLVADGKGEVESASGNYQNIKKLDIAEYEAWLKTAFPETDFDVDVIEGDILEVGYWFERDGKRDYELPDNSFRSWILKERISKDGKSGVVTETRH